MKRIGCSREEIAESLGITKHGLDYWIRQWNRQEESENE